MLSIILNMSYFFLISTSGFSHGLDRTADQFTETVDCRPSRDWSEIPCREASCPIDGNLSGVACKLEYEGRGYSSSDYGIIYVFGSEACIVMNEANLIFPNKRKCYSLSNSDEGSLIK